MGRIDKIESDVIGKVGSVAKKLFGSNSAGEGSLEDRFGTVNTAWQKLIPVHVDGSVDLILSGFIRTGQGTSCFSCKHYLKGHCMKISGYPEVLPTDCCNFYEGKR